MRGSRLLRAWRSVHYINRFAVPVPVRGCARCPSIGCGGQWGGAAMTGRALQAGAGRQPGVKGCCRRHAGAGLCRPRGPDAD